MRVHELVPEAVWRRRYEQISDFERMLAANGTPILKFLLHISKEEQAERLRERLEDPAKRWKFRAGDLEERKRWDDYMAAFERRPGRDLDRGGALVRHPRRPQLVPRLGGPDPPGGDAAGDGPAVSPAEEGLDSLVVE